MLSLCEVSFRSQVLANQLPSEAEGEGSADAIAEAGNTALTGVNLDGKLSAVFGGHYPLDVLDDARKQAAIIVELFGTVGYADAVLFADEFIMRALVDVLEPPPSADVVNQNMSEIRAPRLSVVD